MCIDLSRLYKLYQKVEKGPIKISEAIKIHICQLGNAFIQKSKDFKTGDDNNEESDFLIPNLINLHLRYLAMVTNNFENNQIFHKSLNEAFTQIINKEYIMRAHYWRDMLMIF